MCLLAEKKKKHKHKKFRKFRIFFKIQFALFLLLMAGGVYYLYSTYGPEVRALRAEAEKLVRESSAETFRGSQTSLVYAADGSVISTLKGTKESYYLMYEQLPPDAVDAIVSIEDKKFYRHDGVDYRALLRAFKAMLENGRVTQGGSTITMQLARNIFISQEKTWQRKVEEIFIARALEKKYTKNEIIEFYLNNIYFGHGYYGIQSASRGYFSRSVDELSLSQIAFLCAIPNNPTLYDPLTNMDNTLARRNRILENMAEDGKISESEYISAATEEIILERAEAAQKNDYVETYAYYCATRALMEQSGFAFRYSFATEAEREAYDESYDALYAECQQKLYTGGYQIYTSFDLALQDELQQTIDDALSRFSDVNEEGVYELQASAVCINNETGYVQAMVGGRKQDFAGYTLNRAYQSFRQPGSAIKPLLVYTPLFEQNYTPESVVVDEPIEDGPRNANGAYIGETTVRTAVERSINTIAWRMLEQLSPEKGLSYLKEMNFAKLDAQDYRPAAALGGFTNGVSALEMAAGYAAIANDGKYRVPTCIVKMLDASGNEVYVSAQEEKQVYRQNAARMMTDVLTGVFKSGTGKGLGLKDMPCAGKTGTTNEQKDGWFAGYTRYYTTSVWVGYDMPRKLEGLMGYTYPGEIWQSFMEQAHKGKEPLAFLPYAQMSDAFLEQTVPQPQDEEGAEPLGEAVPEAGTSPLSRPQGEEGAEPPGEAAPEEGIPGGELPQN